MAHCASCLERSLAGLLGVLWTNGKPVEFEGVARSLSALAFPVGFSIEIVFKILDVVITGITGRVGR